MESLLTGTLDGGFDSKGGVMESIVEEVLWELE